MANCCCCSCCWYYATSTYSFPLLLMLIIGHYDLFGSLNICIQGKQQWWGVEFTDHRKLEQLFRNKQCEPYTRGRTYPIVDEVLLRNGIQVQGSMQSAGDCMIIPATIYHWGHAEVSGDTDILVSSLHLWLSSHLLWFPLHHAVNRSEGNCEHCRDCSPLEFVAGCLEHGSLPREVWEPLGSNGLFDSSSLEV